MRGNALSKVSYTAKKKREEEKNNTKVKEKVDFFFARNRHSDQNTTAQMKHQAEIVEQNKFHKKKKM